MLGGKVTVSPKDILEIEVTIKYPPFFKPRLWLTILVLKVAQWVCPFRLNIAGREKRWN